MKISKKNTTKSRLIDYLLLKEIKKTDFYKKTGLGNGFLDKNESINSDKIEIIISNYPDLRLEWLILGNEPILKTKCEKSEISDTLPPTALMVSEDKDSNNNAPVQENSEINMRLITVIQEQSRAITEQTRIINTFEERIRNLEEQQKNQFCTQKYA